MDKAAQTAEKTYTIAARCGVFAKSDIQPLINQGAKSADIAKSIYQAVVNQTIAGLAQGRPIKGHVLYLGGPLTFSKCLRQSFDETLGVTGTCPENSLLFVALGAAFYAEESWDLLKTAELLEQRGMSETYRSQPPLFENQAEYDAFKARHAKAAVPQADFPTDYAKPVHIGIDSGSTTVKVAVIDENAELLFTDYRPNQGDPIALLKTVLLGLYESHPKLNVASVTTTGYGEDLAKAAFHADFGVVETVAHFTAAKHFMPDVDFIIDIGGQEVLQDRKRRHQRHFPQRSLFFRLRQLFADLRPGVGLRCEGLYEAGPVCGPARGSGQPVHGVYELQCEAGPEGRRLRGKHLRGTVHLCGEKRHLQGDPGLLAGGAGPSCGGAGGHVL